jgi:hypothetical protein
MDNSVKYFMWPYQPHFQSHAEVAACCVLGKLDKDLKARLFVVGFLEEKREKRHQICVVPDDCVFQPDIFAETRGLARQLGAYDPKKDGFHTHEIAQENMIRGKTLAGLAQAVQTAIEARSPASKWSTFVSSPRLVEGYLVMAVLQVSAAGCGRHYCLEKCSASGCFTTEFEIERSLIESTIHLLLAGMSDELSKPEPGRSWNIVGNYDDVIRNAGRRLMYAAAIAGCSPDGLQGQFETCDSISTLLYEGVEGKGRLFYIARNHPSVRPDLSLLRPISLHDFGAMRKALQLASGRLSLLCDSAMVYALGTIEEYDVRREDVFEVRFEKQFVWKLFHGDRMLMQVKHGMPALPAPSFPEDKFKDHARRVIKDLPQDRIGSLNALAQTVAAQTHGAMLVISSEAAQEAARLGNQCTQVEPFALTHEMIPLVTAIDGAVLVDLEARCHAIGVILDGLSHFKCTPARGARYNSAVRYAYHSRNCLVVVKSEDGHVDILPDLQPLIRKSAIELRLGQLREFANAAVVERKEFYETMDWLDEHRFYLLADDCEIVNSSWPVAEKRLDGQGWLQQYGEFRPDVEMNASYFE